MSEKDMLLLRNARSYLDYDTLLRFLFVQEDRYSEAVKRLEFDKHLGPYTLSQYGDWKHLSNFITRDTIERLGRYQKC